MGNESDDEDIPQHGLVPSASIQLDAVSQVLGRIRPAWQSRSLIERVKRLLPHDQSSACQRLFNAAVHDLREKVVIAGLDIAKDVARSFKLPTVERQEDVEEYSTAKLIDLCYRMGLLSRPDWRRLHRAYEIRRDLEHEDDEYEATYEDCVYIFATAINAVLSRDPIQLVRVDDVREIVEDPDRSAPSGELLQDYEHAPDARQREICGYLVSSALSLQQADLVRQKAVEVLRLLEPITKTSVKLEVANDLQTKVTRKGIDLLHAKVANAIGALPYLKKVQLQDFFNSLLAEMKSVGYGWRNHAKHGKLLGDLEDVGGLRFCPEKELEGLTEWLILAYIGEPGGYGAGYGRPVFYSNVAAPIVMRLLDQPLEPLREAVKKVAASKRIKGALASKSIERRLEDILDLVE